MSGESSLGAVRRCFYVTGAMCGSFGGFGMWVLVGAWMGVEGDGAPYGNLVIKAVALSLFAGIFAVLAIRDVLRGEPGDVVERSARGMNFGVVVGLVLVAALLLFPGMDRSPKAEPDELHHLIVARNIAEFGVYGSGHPDSGYIEFDQYDSVGAPVLLPVAGALAVGGVSFGAGRLVMVLFGMALVVAVYGIVARRVGMWAGGAAALLSIAAPMSIYLGRTLYGEVPALLFFLIGAACWGRGMEKNQWGWSGVAGVCLGLAILSKTFMVLAAWPFAIVTAHFILATRRVVWHSMALPPLGVAFVVGAWSLYEQSQAHDIGASAASTLFEYQHFLLFGIEPVPRTVMWWVTHPWFSIASVVGFGWAAARLHGRRMDPALQVIFLFAALVIFWWIFYSTGRTPRYLWYACAIGGLFSGMAVVDFLRSEQRRAMAIIVVVLVALPAVGRTVQEVRLIHLTDQHVDERALVDWMKTLPEDTRVATAFWPLQRLGNFAAGRPVSLARGGDAWDVLLWKSDAQNEVARPSDGLVVKTFGPYVAFARDNR